MIKGAFSFGSIKVDLSNELYMSGKIQFEDIYKKTGIKTIYKSSEGRKYTNTRNRCF